MIDLLLDHNGPVKSKNIEGWSTLSEAISYGDRDTSQLINNFCESLQEWIFGSVDNNFLEFFTQGQWIDYMYRCRVRLVYLG